MIVYAHAGHWSVQILYAAPLLVMLVMLAVGKRREKRKAKLEAHSSTTRRSRDAPPSRDS